MPQTGLVETGEVTEEDDRSSDAATAVPWSEGREKWWEQTEK